jgi:hypothetical protein
LGKDADFEGPALGLGFGPGFSLTTDAFFDGLGGLGFGPGFALGIDADVFFLNPYDFGAAGRGCFLNPAIATT